MFSFKETMQCWWLSFSEKHQFPSKIWWNVACELLFALMVKLQWTLLLLSNFAILLRLLLLHIKSLSPANRWLTFILEEQQEIQPESLRLGMMLKKQQTRRHKFESGMGPLPYVIFPLSLITSCQLSTIKIKQRNWKWRHPEVNTFLSFTPGFRGNKIQQVLLSNIRIPSHMPL